MILSFMADLLVLVINATGPEEEHDDDDEDDDGDEEEEDASVFGNLKRVAQMFLALNGMVKELADSKSIRANCLKYGKSFLDAFLKHAMPLLDEYFSEEYVSVS